MKYPIFALFFMLVSCTTTTGNFVEVTSPEIFDDSKKVLMADFKVYFQTAGGQTLEPSVMQEITDVAYAKTKAELTALGYEIVEPPQLMELSSEFKTYSENKMKASPEKVNDRWTVYAPTGWKLDQPGQEVGLSVRAQLEGTLNTTLRDVSARASRSLKALRIQPVFLVQVSTENEKRLVKVMPGTKFAATQGFNTGELALKKSLGPSEDAIDASVVMIGERMRKQLLR